MVIFQKTVSYTLTFEVCCLRFQSVGNYCALTHASESLSPVTLDFEQEPSSSISRYIFYFIWRNMLQLFGLMFLKQKWVIT